MLDIQSIFRVICVCPSFRMDVLSETLKYFPDVSQSQMNPYQILIAAQSLSDKNYIQYDRRFCHYNVERDKAKRTIKALESNFICNLHEKWAEEYNKFLTDSPHYFSEAEFAVLLYHKAMYMKNCTNESQNMLSYLESISKEYVIRLSESENKLSIRRIIQRMKQLDILNELLSPKAQTGFINSLNKLFILESVKPVEENF